MKSLGRAVAEMRKSGAAFPDDRVLRLDLASALDYLSAALHGAKVTHIKPHGMMGNMSAESADMSEAIARATKAIDRDLMQRNLDYQAHRAGGFGLRPPGVLVLRQGGFAEWMRRRGRLGSQNKVPRVIADPKLFADLRAFAAEFSANRRDLGNP